jgi:UDP-glucose 4-epimerase
MVKILITGGMGVIGSMVSGRCVEEGLRPVVMARTLDTKLIASIQGKVDVELADVLDLPRILSIIQQYGITHIVHTAALVGAVSAKNPPQSVHINVIGTLNILEAARLMKVKRVVYTSAKGVYGHITGEFGHPTYRPITEDHTKNPIRIYESAKLMGEHMGQFYRRTYGLEYAALHFGMTFGPGKTVRHGERSVVSRIVEGAYAGTPVKIEKGGDVKNEMVYTSDAAYSVFLACTAPELHYDAYNIGMGGVTLKEIAAEVKGLIPSADIEVGPGLHYMAGPVHPYCVFDHSRAREDLGFVPQFTLPGAIADYLESLKRIHGAANEGGLKA